MNRRNFLKATAAGIVAYFIPALLNLFTKSPFHQFETEYIDGATMREILSKGLIGHIWTADIHISNCMDR